MTNQDYYTCSMHPEIKQDQPGQCPKCGGMKLVKKSSLDSGGAQHDHASMMATPEAAADFLKRFFIVTGLLILLALLSKPAVKILGMPDFGFRAYLEFGIASIIFYFGLVFFRHAKHEIMAKQYGMMTLVSLGVGAGYLFSAASTFMPAISTEFYLEISTLIWVLLFGHFLEAKSSTAAGDALQEVAKLLPKEAHLKLKNGVKEVEIGSLKKGDIVIVKPGEKVPADGEIIKGGGNFNEAHLTGESKPVEKTVKAQVAAGAISLDGSVEVKLLRVGESSTIGQIQNLISQAKQTKPSVQKLADRASRWLTFSALAIAIAAVFIWSVIVGQPFVFAVTLAITVLVIACPHALGLAIPTVSTIATRLAVKNGVFIKDMAKIEIVKGADYVVFDKTGTLTRGKFGVTDVEIFNTNKEALLARVGAIESQSSHMIGMAIVAYLKEKKVKPAEAEGIKNLAGMGMEGIVKGKKYLIGNQRLMKKRSLMTKAAQSVIDRFNADGKTPVFIASEQKILGILGLSDQVKEESHQAVKELHKLGVKVAMLTGDTQAAAAPIAKQLGIDTVFAEVLPEDKYKHIKQLQNQGNVVVMAGDGINDAPALTQANAGVAIGAGTDVAVAVITCWRYRRRPGCLFPGDSV
ncbi:MAG: Cation transporting ATPase, E1-E2 family [Candidatus Beckwithbacteria bacterium GW2011_GWA2_43_10]|uniref:Cation transporting ATPase, E1-E2 family n=1 Tax=Candidatus Beckwithbacteria bacterium GW2011_GWA2_43_10 TaxID=1618369 RepID=A0A0G1EAH8_9BACT|nr:MAG: Cation transporting ATPase, E1-E2 family [Candidatus Beckwithbacteria bacterium GW2011_GWA2_43_10]